ncbi:MAG: cytochrome-c peroxidase, partial [Saprospiraceae bacterium]|nr:cytochrome-c peroxidase [Saprospiraceae bacterium]
MNLKGSLLFICLGIAACGVDSDSRNTETVIDKTKHLSRIYALPEKVKAPPDNPVTDAKVNLGRLLFFDPILSGDRDVACATCHHPSNGFAESRDLSIGTNGQG